MSLLHRDARHFGGVDRRNNFIGSILPADVNDAEFVNVGESLCRLGLAQVHEASAAAMIGGASKLRAAEKPPRNNSSESGADTCRPCRPSTQ